MSADPRLQSYDSQIFDFVQNKGSNFDAPALAEFKKLQRLNLVHLQNELATIKGDIHTAEAVTQAQRQTLRKLLREYSKSSTEAW